MELIAPCKWKGVKKNKRVLLSFTIGSYEDKVWNDVVLMYNLSYLNGKIMVWYANSGASYYKENNKYSLKMNREKFGLASLTPLQIHEDINFFIDDR